MSPVASGLAFEVLRFSAVPVSGDVALLELEGRFRAPALRRLGPPRLLAEDAADRLEVPAVEAGDAVAEPDGADWRGSFALPLRLLSRGVFALAVGRELLVDLPQPDRADGADGASDVHVRLAREANELRRRVDEARAEAAAALARANEDREARERAELELRAERYAREELATRVVLLEQARSDHEAELAARTAQLEQARGDHEAELAARTAQLEQALEQARGDHEAQLAEQAGRYEQALQQERTEHEAELAELAARTAELAQALEHARRHHETELADRDEAIDALRRQHEEELAAQQEAAVADTDARGGGADAEATQLRRALRVARAELESARRDRDDALAQAAALRSDPATVPQLPQDAPPPSGASSSTEDEATAALEEESPPPARRGSPAEIEWGEEEREGVRILGPRPPRVRSGAEPPSEPLPGSGAVGARHIEPGLAARPGAWIARTAALLALAIVMAAVLVLVLGLR